MDAVIVRIVEKTSFIGLLAAIVVILAILVFMIYYIVVNGAPAISWEFLTEAPSRGGREGGIGPAIMGTIALIIGTAIIALPLGIVAGIWLAMYSTTGKVTSLVRHAIDALNGTPSIVFGLFGMAVFVVMIGWGFSLLGGCLTLAFMILPVIIRTTEEAVKAVPHDLLEASMAMGASKWQSIYKVILPAAMGVMALPYHLYYLAMEVPNSTEAQFGTALILLLIVLVMFGLASLVRWKFSKNLKW